MSLDCVLKVLENALPEAIGGASVAAVLFLAEWIRNRIARAARMKKARFAALTELRAIRDGANAALQGKADAYVLNPIRGNALPGLIQVSMERLGDPAYEAALAAVTNEVETFNGLAMRLLFESVGSARAMGGHAKICAEIREALSQSANSVIRNVDDFVRLIGSDND